MQELQRGCRDSGVSAAHQFWPLVFHVEDLLLREQSLNACCVPSMWHSAFSQLWFLSVDSVPQSLSRGTSMLGEVEGAPPATFPLEALNVIIRGNISFPIACLFWGGICSAFSLFILLMRSAIMENLNYTA